MISPLLVSVILSGIFSRGMGEHPLAPGAELRADVGNWRASANGDLSKKLESDQGYKLSFDAERILGKAVLSAAYHHRNGGPWIKRSYWLGAGIGTKRNRVMLSHQLPTSPDLNDVWELALIARVNRCEFRSSVYNYRMTFATERRFGLNYSVGVIL